MTKDYQYTMLAIDSNLLPKKDIVVNSIVYCTDLKKFKRYDGSQWNDEEIHIPIATEYKNGIMKLYNGLGRNPDGTITQRGVTNKILDMDENIDSKEPKFEKNTAFNKNFGTTSSTICQGNDSRLVSTYVIATLSASKWSGDTYSFESTYPNANYNIEISPSENITLNQLSAYNNGQIVGNSTKNVVKAMGYKPIIDIPIMIRIDKK